MSGRTGNIICMIAMSFTSANADVIIGDARLINYGPDLMLITADLSGGLSVIISDLGGGSYQFSAGVAGDPYNIFAAASGLEFTPVEAGQWEGLMGREPQMFSLNETKYYAYWEEVLGSESWDVPDRDDNFGWVTMIYTGTDLEITGSATALGGGIIVGTYTQIPEPSILALLVMGAGVIALARRRHQLYDPDR